MNQWHSGWREATLTHAGIPVTDFAAEVLHHWEQSTPTDAYSNNPLGLPHAKYSAPRTLDGKYAAFPTMDAFMNAFKKLAHEGHGKPLYTVLSLSDSHAEAWRVINSLNLPSNQTETDYPTALLDTIEQKVRESLQSTSKSDRKTVGLTQAPKTYHDVIQMQNRAALHEAAKLSSGPLAIRFIAGRLGHHGR